MCWVLHIFNRRWSAAEQRRLEKWACDQEAAEALTLIFPVNRQMVVAPRGYKLWLRTCKKSCKVWITQGKNSLMYSPVDTASDLTGSETEPLCSAILTVLMFSWVYIEAGRVISEGQAPPLGRNNSFWLALRAPRADQTLISACLAGLF